MGLCIFRMLCVCVLGVTVNSSAAGTADSESAPFALSASRLFGTGTVTIIIPKGHAVYRNSLQFFIAGSQMIRVYPKLPAAVIRYDSPLASGVSVYLTRASVDVPLGAEPGPLRLVVKGQGCNVVDGICYPPFQRIFFLPGS